MKMTRCATNIKLQPKVFHRPKTNLHTVTVSLLSSRERNHPLRARFRCRAIPDISGIGVVLTDSLTHVAPCMVDAPLYMYQRVFDLVDSASIGELSLDESRIAGAQVMQGSGVVSVDVLGTSPERMEGILSPISDSIEAFTLAAQDFFRDNNVPYPLGSAIIFTTFVVKAITFPFTKVQVESALNMQNLQPQTDAIRERYKDDSERINVEINRLYEENQVSPLAGCVPLLLTLPVVWGLYRAFNNASIDGSFDEPWLFIPSLAGPSPNRDLSWLLPLDIDYNPPIGWHDAVLYLIVPSLTVLSQYASMDLLKPGTDDSGQNDDNADSKEQQSLLLNLLPLFIGYVSLTVPAGLTLYWLFNNVFTTLTQVYLRQGGGAVAKIEKVTDVKLKVPLGCAYVTKEGLEVQSNETLFIGPYVTWDDTAQSAKVTKLKTGEDALTATCDGSVYIVEGDNEAERLKLERLVSVRGKRARDPRERDLASTDQLREVVQDFKVAGMEQEAVEIQAELDRLLLLGGDEYISRLKE